MDMAYRVKKPGKRIQRSLYEVFDDVVTALRKRKVPFMLHGAWALAAYGYERATMDVDFLVPRDEKTLSAVFDIMKELRAIPIRGGPQNAEQALARHSRHVQFYLFGWEVDFFPDPDFAKLAKRKGRRKVGDHVVPIIAAKDLKARKLERGMDQDIVDVRRLEAAEE